MTSARYIVFSGVCTIALLALAPSITLAQQNEVRITGDAALEEILVTAQRRVTSLQTTAAAITAMNDATLAARSIADVQDLGK